MPYYLRSSIPLLPIMRLRDRILLTKKANTHMSLDQTSFAFCKAISFLREGMPDLDSNSLACEPLIPHMVASPSICDCLSPLCAILLGNYNNIIKATSS